MGGKSLMKNILLSLSLLTASLYADLSVKQIENMVQDIHKKRVGFNLTTLESTKNPFVIMKEDENITIFVVPTAKTEEVKVSLHGIMSGKAYINDAWKEVNDTVMGYTVKYVGKRGVVLRNGNHIKKLFLHNDRENFITIEGR